MYYELYIDVFWMTNFMMDSLLLFAVRQMLKCPVGKGRIFMGGIVGSTMTCLIVLLPLSGLLRFFAGGILTALVMIRVGFGKQPVRMYRKAFVFLYISAFLMSGILQLFRPYMDTMSLFFVIASAAYAVLKGIQSLWENIQGEQKRICEVLLIQNEKKCRVRALLDTGNLLTDPVTKEPVCVADAQMITAFLGENIDKDSLKLHYLPFRSVGGNGVIPVIRIRQMQITEKRTIQVENPLLAISRGKLSEEEDYQMILNPDIVGGKKDGCKSSNARTV